jgi:hypothetical protein
MLTSETMSIAHELQQLCAKSDHAEGGVMPKFTGIACIFASLSAIVFTSVASAQPPDSVQIQSIDYRGSACPPNTATVDLIDNNNAFVLTYDTFQAQVGPGIPLTESSKFCNLVIKVDYPPDTQFACRNIVYRGNANLQRDVHARFRSRYTFPGGQSVSTEVRKSGPFLGDFELPDRIEQLEWSPCGGEATLIATGTAQLLASERRAQGLVTAEQTDGKFKTKFELVWRHCRGR